MKVRLWGVRGSIAVPGPRTVRYGGNTTCIEVRGDDDALIVLDAGTGIFPLAQSLLAHLPVTAHIFITHTHWDHIQGLPFFIPIFIPGNTIRLYGAFDLIAQRGIEHVMQVQLQFSYFPIREAELKARIEYETLSVGVPVTVGEAAVTPVLMNHPVPDLGYRIECNGKSLFFTGDHEPHYNIYSPGEEGYDEYQAAIEQRQAELDAAIGAVDLLIVDSAYTSEEYPHKRGWGHGTFDSAIELAKRVGAKRLICTHHEPTRSDDDLERVFNEALARHPDFGCEILLAQEGLEITL
ncbi:MAG: MBL fold metallo-hydrolase [Rhodocyclaceae bacterium]|nr:MBL fold metallo-hydrolase [Rhodocyclaceae bacterium]